MRAQVETTILTTESIFSESRSLRGWPTLAIGRIDEDGPEAADNLTVFRRGYSVEVTAEAWYCRDLGVLAVDLGVSADDWFRDDLPEARRHLLSIRSAAEAIRVAIGLADRYRELVEASIPPEDERPDELLIARYLEERKESAYEAGGTLEAQEEARRLEGKEPDLEERAAYEAEVAEHTAPDEELEGATADYAVFIVTKAYNGEERQVSTPLLLNVRPSCLFAEVCKGLEIPEEGAPGVWNAYEDGSYIGDTRGPFSLFIRPATDLDQSVAEALETIEGEVLGAMAERPIVPVMSAELPGFPPAEGADERAEAFDSALQSLLSKIVGKDVRELPTNGQKLVDAARSLVHYWGDADADYTPERLVGPVYAGFVTDLREALKPFDACDCEVCQRRRAEEAEAKGAPEEANG
jgi:hypothetical protein